MATSVEKEDSAVDNAVSEVSEVSEVGEVGEVGEVSEVTEMTDEKLEERRKEVRSFMMRNYIKTLYDAEKKEMAIKNCSDLNHKDCEIIYEELINKDIEKLIFKKTVIDCEVGPLIRLLEESKTTTKFVFKKREFVGETINVIKILDSKNKITNVKLKLSIYEDDEIKKLFNWLETNTIIKKVEIELCLTVFDDDELNYDRCEESIKNMFKNNKTIEKFGITISLDFDSDDIQYHFKNISEGIIRNFKYNNSIRYAMIEVSHPYIPHNYPNFYELINLIKENTTIQELYIGCEQGKRNEVLKCVKEGLEVNITLKKFDFNVFSIYANRAHPPYIEQEIQRMLERNGQPMIKCARVDQ